MESVKAYLLRNFEGLFVLVTLLSAALTTYLLPEKLGFLNFYFPPIIVAGYYLGQRQAVLGAVLCVLMIALYVILSPDAFAPRPTTLSVYTHLSVWGGFLILSGAVVGRLHEKLTDEIAATRRLNDELRQREQQLAQANTALKAYGEDLEARVNERTAELAASKRAVEAMKTKVEDTLYATMDASVANMIIEGRLRNEKRNVTVLFSDLAGFTSYSEDRPPELVIRDLNRYLADIEPIVLAYRGHIDKYMGDGTMYEFGAPLDYETYRLQAVLAAIKLQERIGRQDYPWAMRIGISSGLAITGLIGSKRQTYTAIGDVVNLASRLEKLAAPGRILIDRYTYEDVARFVHARRQRELPLREIHDSARERQLEALHEQLRGEGSDAERLFQIGQIHSALQEPVEAFHYFERALRLDPNHVAFKVAYAEARLGLEAHGTISVKGKRRRVEAHEVVGLKDPLEDRDKIPQRFHTDYRHVAERIQIPADVILPVEALDARIGHSAIVSVLSYAVADVLGVAEAERMDILRAGFFADIGLEIVPHHILNRRGPLSATEYEAVKSHPIESVRMLRKMGYESDRLLAIVQASHERCDGSGYPDGLSGEAIPLGSRIVAMADAYDALTSWRPYRDAWARDAALDELGSGVARGIYDPAVGAALVNLLR